MIGRILLYGGFAAFLCAFILIFFNNLKKRPEKPYTPVLRTGFVLLSLSSMLLIYYFTTDNFSIYYVWLYSSRDLPLYFKLSAIWTGQQGTFMLWTWIGAISLLFLASKKKETISHEGIFVLIVVIFLYFLTILSEPFKLMGDFPHISDFSATEGAGLDPELLSVWMVVHPPITFIAYAAMIIPFSAAVSHLAWGRIEIMKISDRWAEFSWLFFSLGVGLIGGLWTYEAGWGIWTWDASEAGSLIPWLLLTVSIHEKKNLHLRSSLLILTFISIFFSTFIIRSGLWGSVHEFTETSISSTLSFGIIMLIFVAGFLIYKNRNVFQLLRPANLFSLLLILIICLIVFIGLSIPLMTGIAGDEASVGPEFYNLTAYPFVLLLLISLGACLFGKYASLIGKITVILTVAFAFFKPTEAWVLLDPSTDFYHGAGELTRAYASMSLLSIVPPVVFAFAGVLYNFHKRVSIIHLGVILLFFGGVVATSFSEEYTIVTSIEDTGKIHEAGDYSIIISKFHVEKDMRGNWVQRIWVDVKKKDVEVGKATTSYLHTASGSFTTSGIVRTPEADIFLTFPGLEPVRGAPPLITLYITIYPFLNIFWFGDLLLSLGIIFLIIKRNHNP